MIETTMQSGEYQSGVPSRVSSVLDWIRSQNQSLLILATGFQLVVLLTMIILSLQTLVTGDTIRLKVRPVDPRDLFRGDYVILTYDISRLSSRQVPGPSLRNAAGKTVYVTLELGPDGQNWEATAYGFQPPTYGKFIRGNVVRGYRIEYGIESYFVQEGQGLKYEEANRRGDLAVEVALDSNGKAILKRLIIE